MNTLETLFPQLLCTMRYVSGARNRSISRMREILHVPTLPRRVKKSVDSGFGEPLEDLSSMKSILSVVRSWSLPYTMFLIQSRLAIFRSFFRLFSITVSRLSPILFVTAPVLWEVFLSYSLFY